MQGLRGNNSLVLYRLLIELLLETEGRPVSDTLPVYTDEAKFKKAAIAITLPEFQLQIYKAEPRLVKYIINT